MARNIKASILQVIRTGGLHLADEYLQHINLFNFQNNLGFFENVCTKQDGVIIANYDLSEKLHFFLALYATTTDQKYLLTVIDITKHYIAKVSEGGSVCVHLGMAAICTELLRLTGDSPFLNGALSIIQFEVSLNIDQQPTGRFIAANLFILLKLFDLTQAGSVLLKINLFILKLLKQAIFSKRMVCWPYVHKLSPAIGRQEEQTLRFLFFELYRTFGNDSFRYIANHVRVTKDSETYKNLHTSSTATSGMPASKPTSNIEGVVLECLIELSRLMTKDQPGLQRQISKVTVKLTKAAHFPDVLLSGLVHYCAFRLGGEKSYLLIAQQCFDKVVCNKQFVNDFFYKNNHAPFIKSELFKLFFFDPGKPELFFDQGKRLSTYKISSNYPGICISIAEFKQLLLSNEFKRSVVLLRDKFPEKWYRYLNRPVRSNQDETSGFLQFARTQIQKDLQLKKYLAPILSLETKKAKINKGLFLNKCKIPIDLVLKNELLALGDEAFSCSGAYIHADVAIAKILWNPALKICAQTFEKYFATNDKDLIVIRYDPVSESLEEYIVDEITAHIICVFKNKVRLLEGIQKACKPFHAENPDIGAYVISVIRELIKLDWLTADR